MQLVIAILTGLGALAIWYMRIKAIGSAARDVGKLAKRAKNLPRKVNFEREANKTGLKSVTDPRDAAFILMVLVAGVRADKPLETAYGDVIKAQACKIFEVDVDTAEDMTVHALWMVRDVELVSGVVLRMTHVIKRALGMGPPELTDLYEMLVAVSQARGEASPEQEHILGLYRSKVGLSV